MLTPGHEPRSTICRLPGPCSHLSCGYGVFTPCQAGLPGSVTCPPLAWLPGSAKGLFQTFKAGLLPDTSGLGAAPQGPLAHCPLWGCVVKCHLASSLWGPSVLAAPSPSAFLVARATSHCLSLAGEEEMSNDDGAKGPGSVNNTAMPDVCRRFLICMGLAHTKNFPHGETGTLMLPAFSDKKKTGIREINLSGVTEPVR